GRTATFLPYVPLINEGQCVCHAAVYTNEWAMKIRGDPESVDRMADKHGFVNLGQVSLRRTDSSFTPVQPHRRPVVPVQVEWLQQQEVLRRAKRSSRSSRIFSTESGGCRSGVNVAAAWRRGYSGRGVVVSVLDDGIETEHPDLKPNYDPSASYDVNGQDPDPSPDYSSDAANFHGTQCAGLVAAAANHSVCTVGVSFNARIGGIRMLGGDVTDRVEAQALSFGTHHIDIFLSVWGPEDDGATLGGPGPLTRLALQNGARAGRNGRGSVFVWASGSGGRRGDHCSCDGYSNSIYTISISSGGPGGDPPDDLERCAATLAAASGGEDDRDAVRRRQLCSRAGPGPVQSSSVAAGVIALALEANPSLTWRDVQHIIVRTSRPHRLRAPDWHVNGAGHKVSHLYGFGLLDAGAMVAEAERWEPLPSQHRCEEEADIQPSRVLHPGSTLTSVHQSTGCAGAVAFVEHVVARLSVAHRRRGDLSIWLTSPAGTVSELLANRPLDGSPEGFQDWDFLTAHCWGERAAGPWTLSVQDASRDRSGGALHKWSLVIYGTAEQPRPERRLRARSAEADPEPAEEYSGPCDPECSEDGCEGPGPRQCVTCLHFFLKFKNNTRLCVPECPRGFWADRRRCKRCYSSCESCSGSRSDQCSSCQPGHHLTEGANTCSPACAEDSYLDHDLNMCRKCSDNCWKCSSLSICTECRAGSSLHGNRCQRSCEAGSYHDEEDGSCKPCHQACATCAGAGAGSCQRCAEGFLMEEWRCVSSCSPGFYAVQLETETADHKTCRRCDASCLTCVGPSRGNCSSCSGGHSLQDGVCVSSGCSDGQFRDADGTCHSCHATCVKCTGPQSQDCISCASSRALDGGRCVAACARGRYESGGRCHLCDHTCESCVEGGAANCSSCDTDKFGVERYLHGGRCVDACPEAFYHTAERRCEPCSPHCRRCSGTARCLSCHSPYYVSDGRCAKPECGEGEVEDPEYEDCMACQEGCRKCALYNPRHCPSCVPGFYSFQDACYKYCPAKTYSVDGQMTCVPCDDNCMNCDEHECYWCETDLFLSEQYTLNIDTGEHLVGLLLR
uniref:Proprotein convertase subtilisin/kexin type 5a n=1 Tax=Salarias fasciatus TaxID=181472 RepID=A0A672IDD8_SALFA